MQKIWHSAHSDIAKIFGANILGTLEREKLLNHCLDIVELVAGNLFENCRIFDLTID